MSVSIQSLVEAYQEVYSVEEGYKSPNVGKMRAQAMKHVTKEAVIQYLMDEGFVNNEVSAEIFIEHMSDEWLDDIVEGYKKLPVGKMLKQAAKHGQRSIEDEEFEPGSYKKNIDRANKMANVAADHNSKDAKRTSKMNKKVPGYSYRKQAVSDN